MGVSMDIREFVDPTVALVPSLKAVVDRLRTFPPSLHAINQMCQNRILNIMTICYVYTSEATLFHQKVDQHKIWITNLRAPWCPVLVEKLIVSSWSRNSHPFNGTGRFITAFTISHHPAPSNSKLQNVKWVNRFCTDLFTLFNSNTVCYTNQQIADIYSHTFTYGNWPLHYRSTKWKGNVIVITVASKIDSHHLCNLRISKRNENVLVVEDFRPSSSTVFRRSELTLDIKNK
jgi:hypothetical protein